MKVTIAMNVVGPLSSVIAGIAIIVWYFSYASSSYYYKYIDDLCSDPFTENRRLVKCG